MFRDRPRNFTSISDLIDIYRLLLSHSSRQILALLESTMDFLTATSPDFQFERDMWISDDVIKDILEKAALGLSSFHVMDSEGQGSQAQEYCTLAINERLDLLKEKKDRIYTYYATHDNALKTILSHTSAPRI